MSFIRDTRTYGAALGDPNWSETKQQTAVLNSIGAFPRLNSSVEFLRQAHAELSMMADAICGAVPSNVAPQSPPPSGPSLADALDSTAVEVNIIAASMAECVMRIRTRLIG